MSGLASQATTCMALGTTYRAHAPAYNVGRCNAALHTRASPADPASTRAAAVTEELLWQTLTCPRRCRSSASAHSKSCSVSAHIRTENRSIRAGRQYRCRAAPPHDALHCWLPPRGLLRATAAATTARRVPHGQRTVGGRVHLVVALGRHHVQRWARKRPGTHWPLAN
jgi:hypothetical protein